MQLAMNADGHLNAALKRIRDAAKSQDCELDLGDLALESIPSEIQSLKSLQSLNSCRKSTT